MKKLHLLSLLLLLAFLALPMSQALAFTDLEGVSPEARQAIEELAEKQILNGYIDDTFRPGDSISRAEFAKVAALAVTAKTGVVMGAVQEVSFTDVASSAWYAKAVANAVALGLMQGDAEGTFRPNDTVSQAEVLTVLVRALGYSDEQLTGSWPDNYLWQASDLGLLRESVSEFADTAPCTRGEAAVYVARMLNIPQNGQPAAEPETAPQPDLKENPALLYGVVTARGEETLTLVGLADGLQHTYHIAEKCVWEIVKTDCTPGQLVCFTLSKAGSVLSVSKENVYTHNQHEAELDGSQIKLNGKTRLLAADADVMLMNSGGGVIRVNLDKLAASAYVADLRSTDYRAPLQYVSADGQTVTGLLIGDYRFQNSQQFGIVESCGQGKDGQVVSFYGDNNVYLWLGKEEPEIDALYAYTFKVDGVTGYKVDRTQEEVHGYIGDGEIVSYAGDICRTESGTPFIVNYETVIIKVTYGSTPQSNIIDAEYVDEVASGDRVCLRYTLKQGSDYTGLEAAYIIIIDK